LISTTLVYFLTRRFGLVRILEVPNRIRNFVDKTGSNTASVRHNKGTKIMKSIVINKPPEPLFIFWRNFNNIPRFMDHIESVEITGEKTSHWVSRATTGLKLEWNAEVINEVDNELIAWRSLEGSDINHAGSVHFRKIPGTEATRVRLILSYEPLLGSVGNTIAKLLGDNPAEQVQEDLNHFRELIEFGEILPLDEEIQEEIQEEKGFSFKVV
jgi:uncharacterized membrane protein